MREHRSSNTGCSAEALEVRRRIPELGMPSRACRKPPSIRAPTWFFLRATKNSKYKSQNRDIHCQSICSLATRPPVVHHVYRPLSAWFFVNQRRRSFQNKGIRNLRDHVMVILELWRSYPGNIAHSSYERKTAR